MPGSVMMAGRTRRVLLSVNPFQVAEIPFSSPIHSAPIPAARPNCWGSILVAGSNQPLAGPIFARLSRLQRSESEDRIVKTLGDPPVVLTEYGIRICAIGAIQTGAVLRNLNSASDPNTVQEAFAALNCPVAVLNFKEQVSGSLISAAVASKPAADDAPLTTFWSNCKCSVALIPGLMTILPASTSDIPESSSEPPLTFKPV